MINENDSEAIERQRPPVRWIGAPLISGDWFDILPDEAAEILAIVSEYLQSAELPVFLATAKVQRMRAVTIEVYPGWLLVECQAQLNTEAVVLFGFMFGPNGAILLDGRSDAIHAFNKLVGINVVDPQAAAEYLTFFCSAIRSGLGRFEIISAMDDLAFVPGTTRSQKASVRRQLTTLTQGEADEAGIRFEGTVRYGTSLFRTKFRVPPDGRVEMLDDEELVSEAKLEAELFEGPFRIPPARSR